MTDEQQTQLAFAEMRNSHAALGSFILEFSKAELCLYVLLVVMARVSDPVARAIFSGVRTKAMTEHINAIIANTYRDGAVEPQEIKRLKQVMGQLVAITSARDQIVHHGVNSFTEEGMAVTTVARASRYANVQTYNVNAAQLTDMSADLNAIAGFLIVYVVRLGNQTNDALPELSAWRYKPRQPNSPPRKSPSATQKRQRRPKSSPG